MTVILSNFIQLASKIRKK